MNVRIDRHPRDLFREIGLRVMEELSNPEDLFRHGWRTYYSLSCEQCDHGWIRTKTSIALCECAAIRPILKKGSV